MMAGSHCRRSAARAWIAAALTVLPAWPSIWAEVDDSGSRGCPNSDEHCWQSGFYGAYLLLQAPSVHYIVAGRVTAVEGLPDALLDADHEFENLLALLDRRELSIGTIEGRPAATIDAEDVEVEARLRVRNVHKPSPRCPHPPRVENAARCERVDDLPEELTLRIPSDWFLWPATGTSRRVARRAGPHILALRQLDQQRDAGEITDDEHAEQKRELESRIDRALDRVAVEFGSRNRMGPQSKYLHAGTLTAGNPTRLLEDRRAHIEVGGEYLFALGPREEGVAAPFYRPRKSDYMGDGWQVFWGNEAKEFEIAMMLIGNCARREAPLFTQEYLLYGCMHYARGLATFWLYPNFERRQ